MQRHEFYQALADYMARNPRQRRGQAAFNLMHDIYPDTANLHRAGPIDPFYNDKSIVAFVDACLPIAKDQGADQ